MHTGQSTTAKTRMCEKTACSPKLCPPLKSRARHSAFLTSPPTVCISVSRPGNRHCKPPAPVPRPLLNQQAYLTLPGPPYSRTGAVPSTGFKEGGGAPGHPVLTSAVARRAAIPRIISCGGCSGAKAGTTGRMQAGQQPRIPLRPQALATHAAVLQKLLRLATAPRRGRRGCRGRRG